MTTRGESDTDMGGMCSCDDPRRGHAALQVAVEASKWLPDWLGFGARNPWIRDARDPPFNEDSFMEVSSREGLFRKLEHGNWCLGNAFYLGDICFIQQVDGGDEWLTMRRDVCFESASLQYMLRSKGKDYLNAWLDRVESATDDQLRRLEY